VAEVVLVGVVADAEDGGAGGIVTGRFELVEGRWAETGLHRDDEAGADGEAGDALGARELGERGDDGLDLFA
jgi:hypothetical protein